MNAKEYLKTASTLVFEDDPYCAALPPAGEMVEYCEAAARQGMARCAGHWLAHAYRLDGEAVFAASFEACKRSPMAVFYYAQYVRQSDGSFSPTARRLINEWARENPDLAMYGSVEGMTCEELARLACPELPGRPHSPPDYSNMSSLAMYPPEMVEHVRNREMSIFRLFNLVTEDKKKEITDAALFRLETLLPSVPQPPGRGVIFYDASKSMNFRYNGYSRWADIVALIAAAYPGVAVYPVHSGIEPALEAGSFQEARANVSRALGDRYNPVLPFAAMTAGDDSPDWVILISDKESMPCNATGQLAGAYYSFCAQHPHSAVVFYDMYAGKSSIDCHLRGFGNPLFHRIEALISRQKGLAPPLP